MNANAIPLPLASPGEPMRVLAFAHPREMEKRLSSMGIAVGSELRLLQREGGNLVVAVGNSRLA
ncbi:MAG: ferrous iron transport protein A, partial [Zoogloeaceae bacterium]|nr:ferrous iron transport protein A [Zoogloeaceae bacterium]